MHDTYVDRGLIKWRPFDALVGYHDVIRQMKYRRGKMNQPLIDEQKLEELEYLMREAILEALEIEIVYFDDGYVKSSYGKIIQIDCIKKQIKLDTNESFSVSNIIDIKL